MGGTTLPTASSATWVGAPRTTCTGASNQLQACQDTRGALGLSYQDRSASRLTAEFSGRTPALQHAGEGTVRPARHWPRAAKQFMGPGPLQRFVRRHVARVFSGLMQSYGWHRTAIDLTVWALTKTSSQQASMPML
jgi:hypothetical protein